VRTTLSPARRPRKCSGRGGKPGARRRGPQEAAAAHLAAEFERASMCAALFAATSRRALADKILSDGQLRDSILARADVRTQAAVACLPTCAASPADPERLTPQCRAAPPMIYFSLRTEITFQHDGTVFTWPATV